VPIGQVGMVSRKGKRLSMLNGWDLGILVLGERDLLAVACEWWIVMTMRGVWYGYGNDTYVAWILHIIPSC
jgi:hypothetical protein